MLDLVLTARTLVAVGETPQVCHAFRTFTTLLPSRRPSSYLGDALPARGRSVGPALCAPGPPEVGRSSRTLRTSCYIAWNLVRRDGVRE